jgi:hypothetical protein
MLRVVMGVITAAFCEEFVYRGFGFTALRSRRIPLATAAFGVARRPLRDPRIRDPRELSSIVPSLALW